MVPSTTAIAVAISAMPMEFSNARVNSVVEKIAA